MCIKFGYNSGKDFHNEIKLFYLTWTVFIEANDLRLCQT